MEDQEREKVNEGEAKDDNIRVGSGSAPRKELESPWERFRLASHIDWL